MTDTSQPIIDMGARSYSPTLGRFLTTDPIENGTSNDYTYVDDPINQYDLDGRRCSKGDGVFNFHRGHFFGTKTFYLCRGTSQWGLNHINKSGHFGGQLETNQTAIDLVNDTLEYGARTGETRKDGREIDNYRFTFTCENSNGDVKYSFTVKVSVLRSTGNIQTAYIEGNDALDQGNPSNICGGKVVRKP
jgi:hypothetical protein